MEQHWGAGGGQIWLRRRGSISSSSACHILSPFPGAEMDQRRQLPVMTLVRVQVESLWLLRLPWGKGINISLAQRDLQQLKFSYGMQRSLQWLLHCHKGIPFGLGCASALFSHLLAQLCAPRFMWLFPPASLKRVLALFCHHCSLGSMFARFSTQIHSRITRYAKHFHAKSPRVVKCISLISCRSSDSAAHSNYI